MNAANHRIRIDQAIRCRAELREDDAADVEALIHEALAQPEHALPDLVEHFESEARIWALATGAAEPVSNRRTVGTTK